MAIIMQLLFLMDFLPLFLGLFPTTAMSKSAVKISSDLLSNPLCEQDPKFLEMVTALDTAMKRMDSFNQEKVSFRERTRDRSGEQNCVGGVWRVMQSPHSPQGSLDTSSK